MAYCVCVCVCLSVCAYAFAFVSDYEPQTFSAMFVYLAPPRRLHCVRARLCLSACLRVCASRSASVCTSVRVCVRAAVPASISVSVPVSVSVCKPVCARVCLCVCVSVSRAHQKSLLRMSSAPAVRAVCVRLAPLPGPTLRVPLGNAIFAVDASERKSILAANQIK